MKLFELMNEAAEVDSSATQKYADSIEKALKAAFSVPVERRYEKDRSITFIVNKGHLSSDAEYKSSEYASVLTPRRLTAALDPFWKKFRSEGWTFTQPVGGKFTIAVLK